MLGTAVVMSYSAGFRVLGKLCRHLGVNRMVRTMLIVPDGDTDGGGG